MKESSRLWINQNRLWIMNTAATALLSITLLFLLTMVVPAVYSEWYLTTTSECLTLDEIANELAIEQMHSDELTSLLDSLASTEQQQRSYDAILTAIKERCDRRQVSLIGYDRMRQSQQQNDQIVCYRLVVGGRFNALVLLVADLEALPQGLKIRSMALELNSQSSTLIRGIILIGAGVP